MLFKSPSSDSTSSSSTSPPRLGGSFSSNYHTASSPPSSHRASSNNQSFFRRRNGSRSPKDFSDVPLLRGSIRSTPGSGGGSFGLGHNSIANDPTIIAARKKVNDAENAEKEADRALLAARAMVREAREQVKRLEREASEE